MTTISLIALGGVPLTIEPGADLASILLDTLAASGVDLVDGDVVALAQKIVSKAEGRQRRLADVTPSARAAELGVACDKDARLVELILSEAEEVMRVRKGVLVVRHKLGLVLANAGIDQSNIDHQDGEAALLLPLDPDASCRALRDALHERTGKQVGVVMIDSLGRAWRNGTMGTAIGVAGIAALQDLRGKPDIHGRVLQTSELGIADEIAAAASMVMGQANEGTPLVLVRGMKLAAFEGRATDLVRPRKIDLFP